MTYETSADQGRPGGSEPPAGFRPPRICFVSPMLGRHPGYVTSQGLILFDLFREAGFPVLYTSDVINRYARLADTVRVIWRERRRIDMLLIDIYCGPSFVVEDIASLLGRLCGHRIVMVLHGGGMPLFIQRFPRWVRRVLGRAHALVSPSRFLDRAVRPAGLRPVVIPNVISLSAYPFHHRARVQPSLLWMRSFHSIYNPMMAVRVLAILKATMPAATLTMAGQDKGMLSEVKSMVDRLGLTNSVRFPGFLDMSKKVEEAGSADIFINTSSVDNTPVALIEACAMGLPVVSTSTGGIPDLIHNGETGLLTPADEGSMAAAIARLVENPALAARLSSNGRRMAEGCSWEQVRPQWERLFAEVMRRPV